MTSELRAALERALAFDQKSFAAWDADYFREHNATVPTRLAVAQRENARLAPLHAAMLDVIAAAEAIPQRDLFGVNESIRELERALAALRAKLGQDKGAL